MLKLYFRPRFGLLHDREPGVVRFETAERPYSFPLKGTKHLRRKIVTREVAREEKTRLQSWQESSKALEEGERASERGRDREGPLEESRKISRSRGRKALPAGFAGIGVERERGRE